MHSSAVAVRQKVCEHIFLGCLIEEVVVNRRKIITAGRVVEMFCALLDERTESWILEQLRDPETRIEPTALAQIVQFVAPHGLLDRLLVRKAAFVLAELSLARQEREWATIEHCARTGSRIKAYAADMHGQATELVRLEKLTSVAA